MANYPTDSSGLTKIKVEDLIEIYGGEVDTQFAKQSVMREFVDIKRITGGDTRIIRRMSKTKLKKVTPGVRPEADAVALGKVAVTVDTVILARNNVFLLDEYQSDISLMTELAQDHGKTLGKFFDEAFLIMGTKGTQMAAASDVDSVLAGVRYNMTTATDGANAHKDPDVLADRIMGILTTFEEREIDTSDLVVFVRPTTFQVLLNNDKLVSRDFSDANGDYGKRTLHYIGDARIVKTARLPKVAHTGTGGDDHLLSNTRNSKAYNVTTTDIKIEALIIDPMALLAGETIGMTSDIWYNKEELQWFIDSFMAFGVTVRRPDLCGGVFRENA